MGSAVGGLLGTAGGLGGTGAQAPGYASMINPVTGAQANTAYQNVQSAMTAQQNLLQALQGQQGLANQSQIYQQLQGVISGTGPNPAQAMLNRATGQNVANQAALMAAQRGAGANVGLLARQAAMQGGSLQQNAASQAAALQAQQSLGALGAAGNLANVQAGNQIAQTNANVAAQQNEQQQLLNAIAAQNQANVGMQSNINQANATLANTIAGNQPGMIGAVGNALGPVVGMLGGGGGGGALAGLGGGGAAIAGGAGDALGAIGTGVMDVAPAAAMVAAEGGDTDELPTTQNLPSIDTTQLQDTSPGITGPQSSFGQYLSKFMTKAFNPQAMQAPSPQAQAAPVSNAQALQTGVGSLVGGITKAIGLPGMSAGGKIHDHRDGGHVKAANPTQKANVVGNSYANDKIPALLSEGEYVLDRETLQRHDAIGDSARKLVHVLKKVKGK